MGATSAPGDQAATSGARLVKLEELHGVQLELELGDQRVTIPWEGLNLRELCKCGKLRRFAKAARRDEIYTDAAQFTMFLQGTPS